MMMTPVSMSPAIKRCGRLALLNVSSLTLTRALVWTTSSAHKVTFFEAGKERVMFLRAVPPPAMRSGFRKGMSTALSHFGISVVRTLQNALILPSSQRIKVSWSAVPNSSPASFWARYIFSFASWSDPVGVAARSRHLGEID